jgi:hypothetical protein
MLSFVCDVCRCGASRARGGVDQGVGSSGASETTAGRATGRGETMMGGCWGEAH